MTEPAALTPGPTVDRVLDRPLPKIGLLAAAATLFHLLCVFPYLAPVPLPTDTQPWALIGAVAVLMAAGPRARLPQPIMALLLPVSIAALLLLATPGEMAAWRSTAGYLSLFAVSAAAWLLARAGHGMSDRFLERVVLVWFAVGAVQLLVDHSFLTGLVTNARGWHGGRGVTGLATEPSHYATVAAFLLMMLFLRGRERSFAGLLCILQIVFLAQSAQIVLLLAVAVAAYGLVFARPALFVAALLGPLAILTVWLLGIGIEAGGIRILRLLELLMENPALLVLVDGSGNQRMASIFFAFKGWLDNGLLPAGLTAFADYISAEAAKARDIWAYVLATDRIMSGYGAALYELGLFGIAVPLVAGIGLFRYFRGSARHAVVASVLLHPLMLTAVPLALPLVGLLIGMCYGPRRYRGLDEESIKLPGER